VSTARFEFATAQRIVFGAGSSNELGKLSALFGRAAVLVTGKSPERCAPARASLEAAGVRVEVLCAAGEPSTDDARRGVALARQAGAELVVAVGGGSAIDLGKALAALVVNGGDPLDYLEVVGKGQKLERPGLPFIAVPTTAGTGSEATKNSVLESPEHRVKVSLRHDSMLARIAVIDPRLTLGVPPAVTAATGFDALSQVIEPFVSNRSNPMTDALCREAIARSARSLRTAHDDGSNLGAREDLALVSLFGGIALANAKLGAVHGFAGPLGGMFRAPHGALCAALLAPVMRANVAALRARAPDSPTLERYAVVARLLTGDATAHAEEGAEWVDDLVSALGIPPLREYGVTPGDFDRICEKAAVASSMQGNPVRLEMDELRGVLGAAL
jgi:alcohol dehydrogenase class IV